MSTSLMICRISPVAVLIASLGCNNQPAPVKPVSNPPAKVENAVPESKLATLTLTSQACARLGIETEPATMKMIARTRTYGGEVIVPPGRSITVSAPVAGTLSLPRSGVVPTPGSQVTKGTTIMRLLPLLSGDRLSIGRAHADLSEARGKVSQAEVRVETARVKVQRADQLQREQAGSARASEEAHAELSLAETDLHAARARLEILERMVADPDPESLATISLDSQQDGILQSMSVSPGQSVAAGTVLFNVVSVNSLWVRVPVYVGHLRALDLQHEATIAELGAPPGTAGVVARPVPAPFSANIDAASVDLFFVVNATDAHFSPGQRVSVMLRLTDQGESLVVAASAVVFDLHGSAWVYENQSPGTFTRRRVEVRYVLDGQAVLARGLEPGAPVVIAGAAELFGTEFGIGK